MEKYTLNDDLFEVVDKQEIAMYEFGFLWEHMGQIIEQIRSECKEVEQAHQEDNNEHLQEEVGDLIQAAIGLAVYLKLSPKETLLKSINKFQKRFDKIVELAKDDGLENLHNKSFDEMMSYWNKAKQPE